MRRGVRVYVLGGMLCWLLAGLTGVAWSQATEATYVGSTTCLGCHSGTVAKDMRGWQNTLHAKLYREPKPENIIADFTGSVKLSDASRSIPEVTFTFNSNGGKGPFTISFADSTFTVMRAHGGAAIDKNEDAAAPGVAGRSKFIGKQRFQTKIGNSYYILPVQWNPIPGLDGKSKGWVSYNLHNWLDTSGKFKLNKATPEERNCAGCHQTGVKPSVNAQGEWVIEAKEENIACEACHGPGSEHVKVATTKPADMKIVNPRNLPTDRANEVCGQCHDRGRSTGKIGGNDLEYPYSSTLGRTFRPGDAMKDFYVSAGGVWPDGTSRQHHQQWIDFQQSDHFKNGKLTCFDCHTPHGEGMEHGLKKTARDNSLCAQCHTKYSDAKAVQAHTRHKTVDPAKGLGRCVDCHMAAVQSSAVPYDIHAHTFKVISPQVTIDKQMPNTCAVGCHRDGRFNAPTFGIADASLSNWSEASDVALATRLMQAPAPANAPLITLGVPLPNGLKATKIRGVKAGQVTQIEVYGEDVKGATGFKAVLTYDAGKVKFGGFTVSPTIPGLTGLNIRDDAKGTVEIGGTSLEGAATASRGLLGVIRFEALAGFSGRADITLKSSSVTRPEGRKDSEVVSAISLSDDSGAGPIALDLDVTAGKVTEIRDARVGQVVEVEVFGEDIQGAMGFRTTMAYDPVQLKFTGFTAGPTIPGLTGLNLKDDNKGTLEVGGVSLEGSSVVQKGNLGVLKFEVLPGFSGVADVTLKTTSIIRPEGRKDSDLVWKVSITQFGTGPEPVGPPPGGPIQPKAGDGTGALDLDTASGDQSSRTLNGVKPGQQVNVQIILNKEIANASGFQVVLTFDPKRVKVVSGKGDGVFASAIFPGPPQVKDNTVTYAGSFLGQTATARGPVAVLTFETLGDFTGDTEIVLTSLAARVSGVFNTQTPGASVVLSSGGPVGLASDFDGSGDVGFDDFFMFAGAFGQKGTGENKKFDLDGDGDIGFGDFFIFAGDFGKTTKSGKATARPGVNAQAGLSVGTVSSGDRMTAQVGASNVAQMRGYTVVVSYDPSALAFVKAERAEDALLSRGGPTPLFLVREMAPGRVVIADVIAGGGTASGDGALANLVFRRIGPDGAVSVDLAQVFDGSGGVDVLTAAKETPSDYALAQNTPNPFNPETQIAYSLPEAGRVRLTVYNLVGQVVRRLVDGEQAAGRHSARWDGRDEAGRRLASGVYLYRIEVNGFSSVRRMMLVK